MELHSAKANDYFCQKENRFKMHRRKLFFQIAGIGLGAVFVFLWNKITLQHLKLNSGGKKTFPFNHKKKVLFQDDFIITN